MQTDVLTYINIVKGVVETIAILVGGLAAYKWFIERRDRATDVLFLLYDRFDKLSEGRDDIEEDSRYEMVKPALAAAIPAAGGGTPKAPPVPDAPAAPAPPTPDPLRNIDSVLRFYVCLNSLRCETQVPKRQLRACFRYWLAHALRADRKELRAYIEEFYPSLEKWIKEDNGDWFNLTEWEWQ
ncbi:MAG: hypothetical protein HZA54_17310 [Planctomycetes bacterium]|nr:hypothetical protein [Planctomycetota bacterium]